jgi:hypothetical protein
MAPANAAQHAAAPALAGKGDPPLLPLQEAEDKLPARQRYHCQHVYHQQQHHQRQQQKQQQQQK